MKQEERLEICSTCSKRKLEYVHGYVCQITGKAADFQGNCKYFMKDPGVTETIKVRNKPRAWVPLFDPPALESEKAKASGEKTAKSQYTRNKQRPDGEALRKLRKAQSFAYAFLGGLLVSLFTALGWTVVFDLSAYGGAYLALGVALIVGLAVRWFGAGIYRYFGILAALLALVVSLLGYYLSQTDFLNLVQSGEFMSVPELFQPEILLSTFLDSAVPLDLLFYGLAMILSYFLAIRRVNARKLTRLEEDGYKGTPFLYWLRLPVIMAGILVPAWFIYAQTVTDESGMTVVYYETGEKMSEGEMRKGKETGMWTSWYEKGTIKNTGSFTDGLQDSLWISYDETGLLASRGMYQQGVENGTWIHYYSNGVVSDSGAYLEGQKEGLWKKYYESGELKCTEEYRAGKMHGSRILRSPSGQVAREQFFESGEEIRGE